MIECLTQAHTDSMLTQLPEPIVKIEFPRYPGLLTVSGKHIDAQTSIPGSLRRVRTHLSVLRRDISEAREKAFWMAIYDYSVTSAHRFDEKATVPPSPDIG